jgi:signal transduction histidine kinase
MNAAWKRRFQSAMLRCWPDTLFGRLAVLLVVVAIASHVLALQLLFELRPEFGPPPGSPHPFPPPHGSPPMGSFPPPPHHGPPLSGILLEMGVRLGALLLAAWVGARWLSAPLGRLARSTHELTANIHRPALRLEGTRECREAGAGINQLQQHILAQLEERDQFVAAVSHDLRTPLTRLALRAESLENETDRQRFGQDIREMDLMIRATLDHLCGAADQEAAVLLDQTSQVDSIVSDRQEMAQSVHLAPTPGIAAPNAKPKVQAQVSAMRRCMGNLIDNAVAYGGGAEIGVEEDAQAVRVLVSDRGPGIPADALEKVLRPFVRLETSRNRHTGGVGLGLAAVSDIMRRHGGRVELSNRAGGGLQVALVFPK